MGTGVRGMMFDVKRIRRFSLTLLLVLTSVTVAARADQPSTAPGTARISLIW